MKVKCIKNNLKTVTKNKEYHVIKEHLCGLQYEVLNDFNYAEVFHNSHFTIIPDTPQIEVGSEWFISNLVATVKYIGEKRVFVEWNNGDESSYCMSDLINNFKPKPKNMTMYFYKLEDEVVAFQNETSLFGDVLFTREIEL